MSNNKLPTFEESKLGPGGPCRQNTEWYVNIAGKCKHEWQPVTFQLSEIGVPDMESGRVYCVCMKCCGHTYIETAWVGYYIGSPDLLEGDDEE